MKKRVLAFCAAWLLLFGILFAIPQTLTYASEFNTDVRNGIGVVYTCLEVPNYGEIGFCSGTGFFVGDTEENPQFLVTNHHVISDFLAYGAGGFADFVDEAGNVFTGKSKVRVYFDSNDYVEAYVVDYDETKDVALLKLENPTNKRHALRLCSPTDAMIGSSIYVVGYPGLSDNYFADSTSVWGESDASVTSGTISRLFTTAGTGVERIQTDAVIQAGNSGGPMVNSNGSVIGVNSNTFIEVDQSIEIDYYAINIDEVIPMLKIHDVPFVMEGEDEPKSTSPTIFIVIGAVVAAVVVVVVVIVLVMNKNKKKKAKVEEAAAPVIPQTPVKQPAVRSLAAQHNGARYPVQGQVLIGRNPSSCGIVFASGTPGVSGQHCTLSWDAASGDFILTDQNSTYGTFLGNGQKLAPGTPCRLRAGDSFYLGESGNMLRVELE